MNFIQQAYKGKNNWWRYLITILIVMSPFILNFVVFFFMPEVFEELTLETENFKGNKNVYLLENLIPFVVLLILLLLFVKFLHRRSIISLVTSRKSIDWKRFWFGFVTWGVFAIVFLAIGYFLNPEAYVWNFKPASFFALLLVSLLLIPLQTSLEELLFRGYLMQGLGILAKNRWLPLLVTSVLFGLLHSLNPEVEKVGFSIMIFYIGTGLLFGITTLMDEGTELALGIHAINNIVAATLITSNWMVFQTDALLIDTSEPDLMWLMYIPVFVGYPLYLLILSKKYGWRNWKEKLFGKIEKPSMVNLKENYSVLDEAETE